ncbi:medium-chain fatty acid-CoA ligase faa2 [Coemansia thaxteri]|nr:medium-chain fatty acid-CoA ligase faa2 [Coemansia thaxteri]KAJ2472107.1 medium-chain fatty acid-CoA ligase faa2 [Coemansia sp. RSA 2322]
MTFKVPSSEVPGYSAIYRNDNYKDGTFGNEYAHITTLYELFQHQLAIAPKSKFLGTRQYNPADDSFGQYEWLTTTEAAEIVDDFGSGLDHVFKKYAPDAPGIGEQQPVGLYSLNRAEWLLGELSAFRSRRYSVGVCDTVGVEYAEHIVRKTELCVAVASLEKIPRMLDRMAHTPGLRVIISMDRLDCSQPRVDTQAFCAKTTSVELRARATALGLVLLDMQEVIEMGRAEPTLAQPPAPSDLCSLFSSSGTTGAQKCILVPHSAFVHATKSFHLMMRFSDSTYVSFAVIAHCLERCAIYMCMYGGAHIGFYSGDYARLLEDMQVLRPTLIISIPVVLNRMYDSLVKTTMGEAGFSGTLLRMAHRSKLKKLTAGRGAHHMLWDCVVFNKVAAKFGGRIKAILSGGCPSRPEVVDFFRVSLSCDVLHGFGQCESLTVGTMQLPGEHTTGHSGVPCPGVDIRLRSVPETGHLVTDIPCPRGELQLRCPSMFYGYLNEPEKTSAVMDNGWLCTGDIVQVNANGTVSVIDRINHMIRNKTCCTLSPDRIEPVYNSHHLIQASFVHAQTSHAELVAIVVPDPDTFVPWARKVVSQPAASLDTLCASPAITKALLAALRSHATSAGLSADELAGAIYIEPVLFSTKNCGLTTLTHKLRRRAIAEHYAEKLSNMYAEMDKRDELLASATNKIAAKK